MQQGGTRSTLAPFAGDCREWVYISGREYTPPFCTHHASEAYSKVINSPGTIPPPPAWCPWKVSYDRLPITIYRSGPVPAQPRGCRELNCSRSVARCPSMLKVVYGAKSQSKSSCDVDGVDHEVYGCLVRPGTAQNRPHRLVDPRSMGTPFEGPTERSVQEPLYAL